jgi:hypothetical protein
MNDYGSMPLNKIPKEIDLKLQGFDFSLEDAAEWKKVVKPKIPNPITFIENHIASMDALKKRWSEWKQDQAHNNLTISDYEEKLKKCDAFVNLMAEVLLEEAQPTPPIPDQRQQAVLEQTLSSSSAPLQSKEELSHSPKAPWEGLQLAFEKGTPELCQQLFYDILAHPQDFIESKEGENYLKGFSFHECACAKYDRNSKPIRQKLENIIVEGIATNIENASETLRLASIGAGGLLQDLIIVGKLIQKGFKNIYIIFSDNNADGDDAKKFEDMLNKLPGVSIKAVYAQFIVSNAKLHAAYGTDFDVLYKEHGSGWSSVFQAQNALMDKAKLYVFGDSTQIILDKDNHITNLLDPAEDIINKLHQNSRLEKLQGVDGINIIISKDKAKMNFNIPAIAKTVQYISKEFNKPIHLELYGNEGAISAYRLAGEANQRVLKELSGIKNLNVIYNKQEFSKQQQSQKTIKTHILIHEKAMGNSTVDLE